MVNRLRTLLNIIFFIGKPDTTKSSVSACYKYKFFIMRPCQATEFVVLPGNPPQCLTNHSLLRFFTLNE